MRHLVFHGPWKLAVEEAEPPPLPADEVRVAVHSVGVCGSDVHGYAGVNSRRQPGMVMGHEAVGVVAGVGAAVERLAPGQRVAVDPILSCGSCDLCLSGNDNLCESRRIYGCVPGLAGAYAETFDVKATNCVAFEGPAPTEWGALVEPLSVGARAARVGGIGAGDDVFVGLAEETIELQAAPLMVGERSIHGSSAYAADDFRETAAWVASAEQDLSPLIESRVDLDGLPDVFEGYARGRLDAMKTLLQLA